MTSIYLNNPDNWGVGWYRAQLPHKYCAPILAKEGIELDLSDQLNWQKNYDAYIFHRAPHPEFFPYLIRLREKKKKIIWELDDDLFNVEKRNPASNIYRGTTLESLRICLEWADKIIASTDHLRDALGHSEKTVVLPNLLDTKPFLPISPFTAADFKPFSPIRILWAGSNTHGDDLDLVIEPLKRICAKHHSVEIIFIGMVPEGLQDHPRVTFLPMVPLKSYPKLLSHLRPHIALLPLTDCVFNRSKSNIKFLEMTMAGATCIASPVEPYSSTIRHKETGFLAANAEEWFEHLSILLNDFDLKFHQNAIRDVIFNWSWKSEQKCNLWLNFFRSI